MGESHESNTEFPGFTHWEEKGLCCLKVKYVPALKAFFIGHWEIKPLIPLCVILTAVTSFIISVVKLFPTFNIEQYFLYPIQTILFFLFMVSYFRVIIDGPGYFPFFWGTSYENQNNTETIEAEINAEKSSISGIISTDAQLEWAKQQPKPPRSILSESARRIVLRPDHACKWASTWIGKRNQKFFLLVNFYIILYDAIFVIYDVRYVVHMMEVEKFSFLLFVCLILGFGGAVVFLLSLSFLISEIYDAICNRTSWENWNSIDNHIYDKGLIINLEDVFGPRDKWWTWICPISPWSEKTNVQLTAGYFTYHV